MKRSYLVFENGQAFEGERFGAETDALVKLVFTTGMTGYVETLTDPSYAGQIVMQTYPLIGNYGVMREDFEAFQFLNLIEIRTVGKNRDEAQTLLIFLRNSHNNFAS